MKQVKKFESAYDCNEWLKENDDKVRNVLFYFYPNMIAISYEVDNDGSYKV